MHLCLVFASELTCLLCTGLIPMKPTSDSFTQVLNCCDFQKTFLVTPNKYLSCITRKIYNIDLFMKVMPMGGEWLHLKKTCLHSRLWQATCTNTTNKFPKFLCLCSLVRLDEIFRVWWSWVHIINYTIRIVLVCDGFFHYHCNDEFSILSQVLKGLHTLIIDLDLWRLEVSGCKVRRLQFQDKWGAFISMRLQIKLHWCMCVVSSCGISKHGQC